MLRSRAVSHAVLVQAVTSILVVVALGVAARIILGFANTHAERALMHRTELAQARNLDTEVARLQGELNQNIQGVATIDEHLPASNRLIEVGRYLKTTAQNEHLTATFTFGSEFEGDATTLPGITFTLTVHGKREDVLALLSRIAQSPYVISISSVDVTGQATDIQANIIGKIFSQPASK